MPPVSPPSDRAAKRALLQSLAEALSTVSERLRTLETTKRMVFLLAARAETIAEQALRLGTARPADTPEAVLALSGQLRDFARAFVELAARVGDDISSQRSLAEALVRHAGRLVQVAQSADEARGRAGTLAQLRPLVETLTELATRRGTDKAVATDTGELAERAGRLADQAEGLDSAPNGRGLEKMGAALYRGLRGIADDTASVSRQIAAEAEALTASMARMAVTAEKIVTPELAARADTPETRLRYMVRKGHAAMDW
jgi:hypothetical protein